MSFPRKREGGITSKKAAFSLVELSIVLVILGLLTGGILTGQNLIRGAELRAVATEFSTYQTAIMTFRDKYMALPGDMKNATKFWGVSTSGCPLNVAGHVLVGGTCSSGMGFTENDGFISKAGTHIYNTKENFWAWHHLMLAGLIEGSFTGYTGIGHSYYDAVPGVNVPKSKVDAQAGWCFGGLDYHIFALDYSRSLVIGPTQGVTRYCNYNDGFSAAGDRTLTPPEAWSIDTKIDDGMPARGKVVADNIPRCTDAWTTTTNYDAKYSLSGTYSTIKYCGLAFINAY